MKKRLENWMKKNYLDFKWIEDEVIEISGFGKLFVFDNKKGKPFNEGFGIDLDQAETDAEELIDEGIEYVVYEFGNLFYYTSNHSEIAEMNPFYNVGEAYLEIKEDYSHLGIHGHREVLSGSGGYDDWAKRASFFGYKAIGIAEKNTLAGTILFQKSCLDHNIKPVMGMTADILVDGEKKEGKFYVINKSGWKNLLNVSYEINVINHKEKFVTKERVLSLSDGLVFVFGNEWIPSNEEFIEFDSVFDRVFYQLETTEFSSDQIDLHYLGFTNKYLQDWGVDGLLRPILISDSYYINQDDSVVKKTLNMIDYGSTSLQSKEQFFRPLEYHFDKLDPLFRERDLDDFDDIFNEAVDNTMSLAVESDFEIETRYIFMPEYELDINEKSKFKDKYELFWNIIDENWKSKVPYGMDDEYENRLNEEFRVIDDNGFLDYFLMNWDWIIKFCRKENIYTGIGRGSAGGSLLSYLMGVTNIDPIKYGLIFERFLNEGRLKKTIKTNYCTFKSSDGEERKIRENKLLVVTRKCGSEYKDIFVKANEIIVGDSFDKRGFVEEIELVTEETVTAGEPPDIDTDVESRYRHKVKEYLERRYGKNRVFSIGNYNSLGIKSAISDVARTRGIPAQSVKLITKMITDKEAIEGFTFRDFFKKAMTNKPVRKFIEDYPEVVEVVRVVLNNSKTPSVNAAGVVITPRFHEGEEMNAWDWTPVKMHDDQMTSDFTKSYIEYTGMLKLDLLATNVLDKIHICIDSIKKESSIDLDFYDIAKNKTNDDKVFQLFHDGFLQDIFQFSGTKMTKFAQSLAPTCEEDVFAANALYRPATMNLGYHEDYIEMKHGRKEVEYDKGLEEITKDTYGIMIFQESMMEATRIIGGFTLQEADAVRKAMGKKDKKLMDSYKDRFIYGAIKSNYDELDAIKIWNKIEQGAGYGFNKCISGSEKIYRVGTGGVDRFGKERFDPTIEQMYKIKNDLSYAKSMKKMPLRKKYKAKGYGSGFSLNENSKLIKNKIIDIRYEGIRDVYEMTLSDGKTIRTTDNHKFPTSNGEKMLKDISIYDDMIFVNIGYVQEDTGYRFTDKEGSNSDYHNNKNQERFVQNSLVGHEGFVTKGHTQFKSFEDYRLNKKKRFCEGSDCTNLSDRLEIHHIDNDHGNNNHDNLQTLCVSCHKKEHYRLGRVSMGKKGLHTNLVTIKSIELVGKEEVYDVEMEHPYHTFATKGGIVTCNSHAAAYGQESLVTAYLKAYYPVHYYTMSLGQAKDEARPDIISEIGDFGQVEIKPPHVNTSGVDFKTDYENNIIYWSLLSIKQVGKVSVENIVKIRESDGDFEGLDDFVTRTKGHKVNKSHVINIILSGGFDELEDIQTSIGRFGLIKRYFDEHTKDKFPEDKFPKDQIGQSFFWDRLQTSLSGLGNIDYKSVYLNSGMKNKFKSTTFLDVDTLHDESKRGRIFMFAGMLVDVRELTAKASGARFGKLTFQCNDKIVSSMVWASEYEKYADMLNRAKGKILVMNVKVDEDKFASCNQLMTHGKTIIKIID